MQDQAIQKHWDACLIRAWRNHNSLLDAVIMFESITSKRLTDCTLLRVPPLGMPWKIGARVFVAKHLPKINDRLWDQDPEKDVLLLRKLETSKYNTLTSAMNTSSDHELHNAQKTIAVKTKRANFDSKKYRQRNRDTDWNITK